MEEDPALTAPNAEGQTIHKNIKEVSTLLELEYELVKKDFIESIKKNQDIVLSTCQRNIVTSRTVSFINNGFTFYILTSVNSNKCKQIAENENVSLCSGDLQMEGKARIIGHPMSEGSGQCSF